MSQTPHRESSQPNRRGRNSKDPDNTGDVGRTIQFAEMNREAVAAATQYSGRDNELVDRPFVQDDMDTEISVSPLTMTSQPNSTSQNNATPVKDSSSERVPGASALRSHNGSGLRTHTRFLIGLPLDRNGRVVTQVLEALKCLLEELVQLDPSFCFDPWAEMDWSDRPVITLHNYPEKLSDFTPYCDNFRSTMPYGDKKWYTNMCFNYPSTISLPSLMIDLEEVASHHGWFIKASSIQSDKRVKDIGWFAFSLQQYATPEFRDKLAVLMGIQPKHFSLQWRKVQDSGELWAMVAQSTEDLAKRIANGLGDLYSSQSLDWPLGIRMRFVPYLSTVSTHNKSVDRMKSFQMKFSRTFKAHPIENLKVGLDETFQTSYRSGEPITITLREALMGISRVTQSQLTTLLSVPQRPPRQGVFHSVVEYQDRSRGRKVYLVPYPSEQVGGTVIGELTLGNPITILSHIYSAQSIHPLFESHAVDDERGTVYDEENDAIHNRTTMDLEASLEQDAKVFVFALDLLEMDNKKRRVDGNLVRRLDDSSVGTVRANTPNSVAGSSFARARPSS